MISFWIWWQISLVFQQALPNFTSQKVYISESEIHSTLSIILVCIAFSLMTASVFDFANAIKSLEIAPLGFRFQSILLNFLDVERLSALQHLSFHLDEVKFFGNESLNQVSWLTSLKWTYNWIKNFLRDSSGHKLHFTIRHTVLTFPAFHRF